MQDGAKRRPAFSGVKRSPVVSLGIVCLLGAALLAAPRHSSQDWTQFVRIGAYSLKGGDAGEIVRSATADHVFGIEVDNDIPGRYESFLDPTQKLAAIRQVAAEAHAAGNRAFVYIAGLECITAHADRTPHTLAKDHPDWLQRKITGEPAVFGGGTAFWISPGDEDVWITPYAPGWRKLYMERVRQIAATGIDGIYVDIPYWMTHFEGWENTWASFDDYTVAAFRKQTGLDARHELKLGDFNDANFRQWVNFRIHTITDFMREIDQTAKSVNPSIKTIPEIYPGIEEPAVRVGADVYELYPVVDAIAHEYEFGEGDHMASSRTPLDWFKYQVGMRAFRAFAEGKPTWILNYSWDGDRKIDPRDAMQNLAMSQLAAGANFWDAPGHVMAGSNDRPTRRRIFDWIARHEAVFYSPRKPINPVGVYFSPKTRDYFPNQFIPEFQGCSILLMQKHWEFQVVTPRNLAAYRGDALVLPDVRILDDSERSKLQRFVASGKRLLITGTDASQLPPSPNVVRLSERFCANYLESVDANLEKADPNSASKFLNATQHQQHFEIIGSPQVVTHIAEVDGTPHIFVANFNGLRGGANAVPSPETAMTIKVSRGEDFRLTFLPFLGEEQTVAGQRVGPQVVFHVPSISRGAVLWFTPQK